MAIHATLRTRCGCTRTMWAPEGPGERPKPEIRVAMQRRYQAWYEDLHDAAAATFDVRVFRLERYQPSTPNIHGQAEYREIE